MYRINVPGINNAFKVENFYFGGQPDESALEFFLNEGVEVVYNLRSVGEADFQAEEALLKAKGVEYNFLPFLAETGFSEECINNLNQLKQGAEEKKVLIHCASGNRIGGWYLIYLVKVKGLDFTAALAEAEKAGLSNPGLAQGVKEYLGL